MNYVKSYNPNFHNKPIKSMVQQKAPKTKIVRVVNEEFVPINKPTLTTSSTSGNRRNWNKKQTRSND